MASKFRVLDAARNVVDEVNRLIITSRRRLINEDQLRKSAGSITANIREAYGRRKGPERNQYLRVARSSSDETDEHLRGNFAVDLLAAPLYWRLHNRLAVVSKMLTRLMSQ
jgi:four helix bundle protein